MAREIHVFRTPDRFVAGTVGQPGNRTFYLQAVHDSRVVSVILEKQQVAVLAERIGALLAEVNRRFGTPIPPDTGDVDDLSPLVTPVDAEFRVGTMGLGWDSEAQTVVVELLAVDRHRIRCVGGSRRRRRRARRGAGVLDPGVGPPVRGAVQSASSRRAARRARCATSRSIPRAISACAANGYRRGALSGHRMTPKGDDCEALRRGELTVIGRIRSASNATFLCEAQRRRPPNALRVQADRRRGAAVGFPRRHAGGP